MKEFKVTIPEGMEIDKENSTFECIKFKPIKPKRWRDNEDVSVSGYIINNRSEIVPMVNIKTKCNYCIFNTKKQTKSALAMARISQIMANDERFGGVVTDEKWRNSTISKYVIVRWNNHIDTDRLTTSYHFLAFHTAEQRDLFLKENEDLVKDYLMID